MKSDIEFEAVYNSYYVKIHRYVSRLIGPYHAEDVTQEVFNKISKKLDTLKEPSKLATWLYRIATNTAIDKTRTLTYKNFDRKTDEEKTQALDDRNAWTGNKAALIDQKLIKEEMRSCVQEFIGRLPENHRTVLILKDYEEKSNQEIARILGLTVSTVKIRYHRAKKMLKKELDSGCDFFYDDENRLLCDRKQGAGILKKPPQ